MRWGPPDSGVCRIMCGADVWLCIESLANGTRCDYDNDNGNGGEDDKQQCIHEQHILSYFLVSPAPRNFNKCVSLKRTSNDICIWQHASTYICILSNDLYNKHLHSHERLLF